MSEEKMPTWQALLVLSFLVLLVAPWFADFAVWAKLLIDAVVLAGAALVVGVNNEDPP